ncbi:pyrroline-5-carboxylate reductase [Nocardiopsis potens]|uniref:pyrroline-5-carboxylate reductase n=1 Tax=Nocardiopsis potens TaxID=1246458 RepID=UPI00034B0A5E|nr:pyrroline-5-carboxylate reductase [Nocardiopsis potens]
MEHIGIIGVGEIARAIVEGLSGGVAEPPRIHLSPRGAATAAELARRYPNAEVRADNQDVADRSDVLILAVRPQDAAEALAGLRVDGDRVVVSAIAGIGIGELRRMLGTGAPVVRTIPMPAVRERRAVTVVHPSHPVTDALFDRLGGALPVADEAAFSVFSTLTGTLSSHYRYLAVLTEWAAAQGVPAEEADRYVRGLFQGVGRALGDGTRSLQQLAGDHETRGGSNERIRTTWFDAANSEALTRALDGLLEHLR